MKETDLAYLAGLLDGEGHFGLRKSQTGFAVIIQVQMTDEAVLTWARNTFGGNLELNREATEKHERVIRWTVGGKEKVKPLLLALLPYLKVKKANAEVLYSFCKRFGRILRWETEGIEAAKRFVAVAQALNSKGPGSSALKDELRAVL